MPAKWTTKKATTSAPADENFNDPVGTIVPPKPAEPTVEILSAEEVEARQITTLVEANITDQYIESVKDLARGVTVYDDESLEAAINIKKVVRSTRTTGVKIFEFAREDINRQHKIVMDGQKAFIASLAEVEDPLDDQIKTYREAEKKRLMDLEMEKKLPHRMAILSGLGINWVEDVVKPLTDDEFNAKIAEVIEAKKIADAQAKRDEEIAKAAAATALQWAYKDIRIKTLEAMGYMYSANGAKFIYQNIHIAKVDQVAESFIMQMVPEAFDQWVIQNKEVVARWNAEGETKKTEAIQKAADEAAQKKIDDANAVKERDRIATEAAANTARIAEEAKKGEKQKLQDMVNSLTISYAIVISPEAQVVVDRAKACIAGTKKDLETRIANLK